MYALNLDETGRILSATLEEFAPEDAPRVETLPEGDISLYRYEAGKYILDAAAQAERQAAQVREEIAHLWQQLRATDGVVVDALEGLLSSTTLTGFLSTLVKTASSIKDTLAERNALRKEIEKRQNV